MTRRTGQNILSARKVARIQEAKLLSDQSERKRSNMRKRNSACCMLLCLVIAVPFAFAEEQAPISRLPPLPQPLDPILQDMFDKRRAMGGAIINLSLTTGHAPKFARASGAMAFAIRFETSTPRRLIELVIFPNGADSGIRLRAKPAQTPDENVRLQ
jgi:hypothetical protein